MFIFPFCPTGIICTTKPHQDEHRLFVQMAQARGEIWKIQLIISTKSVYKISTNNLQNICFYIQVRVSVIPGNCKQGRDTVLPSHGEGTKAGKTRPVSDHHLMSGIPSIPQIKHSKHYSYYQITDKTKYTKFLVYLPTALSVVYSIEKSVFQF